MYTVNNLIKGFLLVFAKAGYPLAVSSVPGLTHQPKCNSTYILWTRQNKFLTEFLRDFLRIEILKFFILEETPANPPVLLLPSRDWFSKYLWQNTLIHATHPEKQLQFEQKGALSKPLEMSGRKLCPGASPCSLLFLGFIREQGLLPAVPRWEPVRMIYTYNCKHPSLQNWTAEVLKSLSRILLCLITLAHGDRWFHRNTFRSGIATGQACQFFPFSELRGNRSETLSEAILVSSYDSCFDGSGISYYSWYSGHVCDVTTNVEWVYTKLPICPFRLWLKRGVPFLGQLPSSGRIH